MLPDRVVEALPRGARVVEVGVGGRFEALAALREARPDLALVATDVDPAALEDAPEGVQARLDDAFDPDPRLYEGACLVFAVRAPEDLQPALARLAAGAGASLALSPLGTELAPLDAMEGQARVIRGERAWHWWPRPLARGEDA